MRRVGWIALVCLAGVGVWGNAGASASVQPHVVATAPGPALSPLQSELRVFFFLRRRKTGRCLVRGGFLLCRRGVHAAGHWGAEPARGVERGGLHQADPASEFDTPPCTRCRVCRRPSARYVGSDIDTDFHSTADRILERASWTTAAPSPDGSLTDSALEAVSCTTTSFCLAVGQSTSSTSTATLTEEWNGSTWSVLTSPGVGELICFRRPSAASVPSSA